MTSRFVRSALVALAAFVALGVGVDAHAQRLKPNGVRLSANDRYRLGYTADRFVTEIRGQHTPVVDLHITEKTTDAGVRFKKVHDGYDPGHAATVFELRGWRIGLEQTPNQARPFYAVIALAFALGLGMLALPIDPIKALFWSAVLNGVIAVPLMVATMLVASSRQRLGPFVAGPAQRIFGWIATVVMAAAAVAMFTLG